MAGPLVAAASEFEAKLTSFVRDNRLYGAAAGVVHDAELAWSGAAGWADAASGRPAAPGDLFRIASITKTFTGTAIMQLRDAGALNLDDAALTWIPELAGSASSAGLGAVTIRRLLSHESGLVSQPPGTDFTALPPAYEGAADRTLARVAEIFTAIPPHAHPKYSNLGYQLLGEIVQRASGEPYRDYVARRILVPLGLSSTGFEPLDPSLAARCATGYSGRAFSDELTTAPLMPPVWAEGGLWSSVEDLGRWISFQLSAYADEPRHPEVLSAASRKEMHKPRYLGDEEWSYAFGITWIAVRKDAVTWIQHSGGLPGFTSLACFDRTSRVGAIALVNGSSNADALAMALAEIARTAMQAAAPAPIARPAATPDDIRPLLGLYAPADLTWRVRLEWRDGKLTLVDEDAAGERVPLERGAEAATFVVTPGFQQAGETVTFSRRPDGAVLSLFLAGGTLLRLEPVPAVPPAALPPAADPPAADPPA